MLNNSQYNMLLQVKRINIIGVNTLHQPPNNAQQDQQNDRVTRPTYSYNCVKYRSINDQKFNELKQKLTAAGFELDTEQVNCHSTGIANTSRSSCLANGKLLKVSVHCCRFLYSPSKKLVFVPIASAMAGVHRDFPVLASVAQWPDTAFCFSGSSRFC